MPGKTVINGNKFSQPSLPRLPNNLFLCTQTPQAACAQMTGSTRYIWLDCYAFTQTFWTDMLSNSNQPACNFMAKHRVPMERTFPGIKMQIRSAKPYSLNFDQYFVWQKI